MPTLYAYSDGSGFYAKANLNGAVVTFQLSASAVSRLTGLGLTSSARLPRNLLLALIQSGDAFTGAGTPVDDPNQVPLPFGDGELDADGVLPRCEETGGHIDLHLVVLDDGLGGGKKRARLLTLEPRHVVRKLTALSVPVAALTRRSLDQLVAAGKIPAESKAVKILRGWFDHQLASAWDEVGKLRAARQTGLGFEQADELPLG